MSKKLFINHSTKDDTHVDRIADALEAAGFTVWVDHRHGIEPGTPNWDKAIRGAIVEADAGIFLMSERSLSSDICAAECLLVRELNRPLYVMKLEFCEPQNVWLYIKMIQYADLTSDFDFGVNSLVRVLHGDTDQSLPQPVIEKLTGTDLMHLYLPYLSKPLRGRDKDIEEIQIKLDGSPRAVLQLVGTGGLGKSRLAAEVALSNPNGAVWHRCSPVSEPAELMSLLREHLGLPSDVKLQKILIALSEKRPLIVVDNAEDVPTNSDKQRDYMELLQQIVGRGVPAMITSRAVWADIRPRRDHQIVDLTDLEVATQIALDFAAAEAVSLTVNQARDLAAKAQLHPGLIEFSVGQLHERSVDRVLEQLGELTQRDVQKALDEMILKSIRQMAKEVDNGADAEALLRRIAVLHATFAFDAIKALAPDVLTNDSNRLNDALVTLLRWQFVRRDYGRERYSLGSLVHEALQPLIDKDVFMPYVAYYVSRADTIFNLPVKEWKTNEDDYPNILALGDMLVVLWGQVVEPQQGTDDTLATIALAFARSTINFVVERSEYRREAWLEMGLATVRVLGDVTGIAFLCNKLGLLWAALGSVRKGLIYQEEALSIYRTLKDMRGEGGILNSIGSAYYALGENRKALEYYEQALAIMRSLGDENGQAMTLNNIGTTWQALGEPQKAINYHNQALPLRRSTKNQHGEATSLHNLGAAWERLGQYQKALNDLEQALLLRQEIDDRRGEAYTLNSIGTVKEATGEPQQALDIYEKALLIRRKIGDLSGEGATLNNIGTAWRNLGKTQKALEYYERALPLRRIVEDYSGEAITLNNIGLISADLGENEKALEYYEQSLQLKRRIGDRYGEALTLYNIGTLLVSSRDKSRAVEPLQLALQIFESVGNKNHIVRTNGNLGALYHELGDDTKAMQFIERAIKVAARIKHADLNSLKLYLSDILKHN